MLGFREAAFDGILIISSSTLKSSKKFIFVRWKDEDHEGIRHGLPHLSSALDIDVENDQLTLGQCRLDGASRRAVGMTTEDLGPLQKFTTISHPVEFSRGDKVVIRSIDLVA